MISDEFNVYIPPACGAAVSAVYTDTISKLQEEGKLPRQLNNIVVIVCGGGGADVEIINKWRKQINTIAATT